jgi:N6-L-threonylcarbamoyladenine synthase
VLSLDDVVILGIETSCDETAAAVVRNGSELLSNVINSQINVHRKFGGVVPEVASRKHIENISGVVEQALADAALDFGEIDVVAVTNRPGLIGALLVGVSFAKGLAYALDRPLIAVNHLEGHIYANFLENPDIEFPVVCLVVSGGHTSLVYMESHGCCEVMGETRDDAAGEAFDKVARFLGLGYPGGPAVERAARDGQPGIYQLPRVYLDRNDFEFSFSGLKTATMNQWNQLKRKQGFANVNDLAAEFQAALVEVLVEKTVLAGLTREVNSILLAGGVAANGLLREQLASRSREEGLRLYRPSMDLCTDNAAMIAGCAYHQYLRGETAPLNLNAYAGLDLL